MCGLGDNVFDTRYVVAGGVRGACRFEAWGDAFGGWDVRPVAHGHLSRDLDIRHVLAGGIQGGHGFRLHCHAFDGRNARHVLHRRLSRGLGGRGFDHRRVRDGFRACRGSVLRRFLDGKRDGDVAFLGVGDGFGPPVSRRL
ncbi:hypothetical protein D0T12_00540 [Actinomadura spongiicola]|uniref:Uncharacterized protein n=1 Tax=Actinomadura spongiicola TaxID=2303421 RepID=A0A372GN40_9ACTN|nr:hypothetical protein D0T12_00540 [Actinomadura spongiicola]